MVQVGKARRQQSLFDKHGRATWRDGKRVRLQRRKRPGRKPNGARAGAPHTERPELRSSEPVHVVLRVVDDIGNLRRRRMYKALREATITAAKRAIDFNLEPPAVRRGPRRSTAGQSEAREDGPRRGESRGGESRSGESRGGELREGELHRAELGSGQSREGESRRDARRGGSHRDDLRPGRFRIVHLSIQRNHIHLLCEADNKLALARGMQGFQISAAKHLNRALTIECARAADRKSGWYRRAMAQRRRGTVFPDRYHLEVIRTPAQARRTLAYVLNNWRKHREDRGTPEHRWSVDPYSSGVLFDGWKEREDAIVRWRWRDTYVPLIVYLPKSWLLRVGWRKHGLVTFREVPSRRTR